MYKLYFIILFILLSGFFPTPGRSQEKEAEKTNTAEETTVLSETAPSLDAGQVIFFPDNTNRPSDDRFNVKAGEIVEVCLKINPDYSPVFQEIIKTALSFRMVLEDDKTPPSSIVINGGDKKNPLVLDAKGCFRSSFQIPPETNSGIYQVADLFFDTRVRNFISVNQSLYDFSQADELKVENDREDSTPPELLKIGSFQNEIQPIGKNFGFLKIQVTQYFTFKDEGSGLMPKTLKVFYLLSENDQGVNIYPAQCKKRMGEKGVFRCRVKLLRPEFEWERTRLSLELESIYINDKAGNLLILKNPETFLEKAEGTPTKFIFEGMDPGVPRKIKYKNRHPNRLKEVGAGASVAN